MNLSKFGLLFVVFVDVMGQGLIFPIVNTLIMDPGTAPRCQTASPRVDPRPNAPRFCR